MDIQAALNDGYTEEEVMQELGRRTGMDYKSALSDGYSVEEVLGELNRRDKPKERPQFPDVPRSEQMSIAEHRKQADIQNLMSPENRFSQALPQAIAKMVSGGAGMAVGGLGGLAKYYREAYRTGDADKALKGATEAIQGISEATTMQPETKGGETASKVMEAPLVALDWTGEKLAEPLADKYPNLAATIRSAPQGMLALWGVGKGLTPKQAFSAEAKLSVINKGIERVVNDNFDKAIKPSVTRGKKTASSEVYDRRKVEAVKTIVENKDKLQLTDKDGNVLNKLPESRPEMKQAADQTRLEVFREYDAIQKRAGAQGAEGDLNIIANELDKVSQSQALIDARPEVVEYAMRKADTYRGKRYTTQDLQDAITVYNESYEAFARNPTWETASKAKVDAMIVNNMRKMLDDIIQNTTGEQYQVVKNKYASLKEIEKDVNRSANRGANESTRKLIDFTDVLTANHVLHGLVSGQPAYVIGGMGGGIMKKIIKAAMNPDKKIKAMFKDVDKLIDKRNKVMNRNKVNISMNPVQRSGIGISETPVSFELPVRSGGRSNIMSAGPETTTFNLGGKVTAQTPLSKRGQPLITRESEVYRAERPVRNEPNIQTRTEPDLTNQIRNTPRISSKTGMTAAEIKALEQINAFRIKKGLKPVKSFNKAEYKEYRQKLGRDKINAFLKSKGLPSLQ